MNAGGQVQIIHAAQANALKVTGENGIVAVREHPEGWKDPTSPDYLGARREQRVTAPGVATQAEAEALADHLASQLFHGWVEFQESRQ
jgi:hypothetical protein